jgi:hypothetical protein
MRFGLICLLFLPAAVAQSGADPWSGLRAKNPPGIEVSLRLLREGSYREGELIRAEVHYPGRSFPPPQGRPSTCGQRTVFCSTPPPLAERWPRPVFRFSALAEALARAG